MGVEGLTKAYVAFLEGKATPTVSPHSAALPKSSNCTIFHSTFNCQTWNSGYIAGDGFYHEQGRNRLKPLQRNAAEVRTSATLIATLIGILIGAPFRRCLAEGREHGPPSAAASTEADGVALLLNAAPAPQLTSFALRIPSIVQPSVLSSIPRGVELRHAFVQRTVTHSFWGAREHYTFASTPDPTSAASLEERQRRQVAIHLGRAVSQHDDASTASRIENIYSDLQLAHWGRHSDGLLGGHFNFDYSAVRCVDLDRRLPHARYGSFASLHFHHDQERVHVDAANPFGLAGTLVPVHFFLDVVAGHIPWHRRAEVREVRLTPLEAHPLTITSVQ